MSHPLLFLLRIQQAWSKSVSHLLIPGLHLRIDPNSFKWAVFHFMKYLNLIYAKLAVIENGNCQ